MKNLFLLISLFLSHSTLVMANEYMTMAFNERFGKNIEVDYLTDLSAFQIQSARLVEERAPGKFDFFINNEQKITVEANIFVNAYFPKNKISPKQTLKTDLFEIKRINIVREMGRDIRSVLISTNENLEGYQSKFSLLPNDALTLNALQKVPTVKNGDRASLRLWVEGIMIHTPVVIQEEGIVGELIKVEIQSTKKMLQGTLLDAQTVEVRI